MVTTPACTIRHAQALTYSPSPFTVESLQGARTIFEKFRRIRPSLAVHLHQSQAAALTAGHQARKAAERDSIFRALFLPRGGTRISPGRARAFGPPRRGMSADTTTARAVV